MSDQQISIDPMLLKQIIEAALMATGEPLTIDQIKALFDKQEQPSTEEIRNTLNELKADYEQRGIALNEIASGFCFQVNQNLAPWIQKLWQEKPPRYSRAVLETLAIIAYRQPITRAEIEAIRGVAVSTHIVKTLTDREWIRVVGERDVPGKPALYGTTKQFLDYFNLKSLEQLPTLMELTESLTNKDDQPIQLELADLSEQKADMQIEESKSIAEELNELELEFDDEFEDSESIESETIEKNIEEEIA